DPPGQHVAAVAVGAPLLARRSGLVLDDRPTLTERVLRARMDVGLVVGPVDRGEVELAARPHSRSRSSVKPTLMRASCPTACASARGSRRRSPRAKPPPRRAARGG